MRACLLNSTIPSVSLQTFIRSKQIDKIYQTLLKDHLNLSLIIKFINYPLCLTANIYQIISDLWGIIHI